MGFESFETLYHFGIFDNKIVEIVADDIFNAAVTVTAMHFLIIVGFMPLAQRLSARLSGSVTMHITYEEGRGVMSRLLEACDRRQWLLTDLAADAGEHISVGNAGVLLTLSGRAILTAPTVLAGIDGVTAIRQLDDEPD